jgi:hypothetical protein
MAEQPVRLVPRFTYSAVAARFRDRQSGRFVPEQAITRAVDALADTAADRMVGLTRQLRAGGLSLADWQGSMQAEIRVAHLAGAVVARGGFGNMAPADYGWIGQRVRQDYRFLERFSAQIASGQQPLDGRAEQRAALYGRQARTTQREMARRVARLGGDTEERNVLHAAESCSACVAQSARGWVRAGTLTPIGSRLCLSNDRCSIETRSAAEAMAA